MKCVHHKLHKETKLCLQCGEAAKNSDLDTSYILSGENYVRQSKIKLDLENLERLLMLQNKILLFLDVDNTILEAKQLSPQSKFVDETEEVQQLLRQSDSYITLYSLIMCRGNLFKTYIESEPVEISFRPGFFQFLQSNLDKIVIVIYTLGTYEYASKVVQFFDPEFKLVYRIIARKSQDQEKYLYKNMSKITQNRDIMNQLSIIFDDSSRPWSRDPIPQNFLKSLSFAVTPDKNFQLMDSVKQPLIPVQQQDDNFVLSEVVNYSFAAEKQFVALQNIIIKLIQTHPPPSPHEIRDMNKVIMGTEPAPPPPFTIREIQGQVFDGCLFYMAFVKERFHFEFEHQYIKKALFDGKEDLRVLTILQYGGRVSTVFNSPEITHFISPRSITRSIAAQLKLPLDLIQIYNLYKDQVNAIAEAYGAHTMQDRRYVLTAYGEENFCNIDVIRAEIRKYISFNIVDQHFIYLSAYLGRRQDEFWWTWAFLAQWNECIEKEKLEKTEMSTLKELGTGEGK